MPVRYPPFRRIAFAALWALIVVAALRGAAVPVDAQVSQIVVTSAADPGGNEVSCDGDGECTLREAIETANETPGNGEIRIVFDPAAFPPGNPTVIVPQSPLPAVTRAGVVLDGGGAGVTIDGSALDGDAPGLELAGAGGGARGLALRDFEGPCVLVRGSGSVIGGDRAAGGAVRIGSCDIGIDIRAEGTQVRGIVAGFERDGITAAPVDIGIAVQARNVSVGGLGLATAIRNVVANARVAISVGGGDAAVSGTLVAGNLIGLSEGGARPGAGIGVEIGPGGSGIRITENTFAATGPAAIALPAAATGTQTANVMISANSYVELRGLEIDLGADSLRNPNDTDDADSGPNGMLNHPLITRPTQAAIEGIACSGCRVELYRVDHKPGRRGDHATQLIGSATAGNDGAFTFASPPVAPGEWITAMATDPAGNSSEFALSTRVGSGAIQCGNISLSPGWNLAGYFGAATVSLGRAFPGDSNRVVRAVYELGPNGVYSRWLRDSAAASTLPALVPGRAYWFLLDGPLVLPDGFSLTAPLGVQLHAGWNMAVYFGGGADVLDAFSTLLGRRLQVYRFEPSSDGGQWLAWGSELTPGYARAFDTIEPCEAYAVFVDEATVLSPLHP